MQLLLTKSLSVGLQPKQGYGKQAVRDSLYADQLRGLALLKQSDINLDDADQSRERLRAWFLLCADRCHLRGQRTRMARWAFTAQDLQSARRNAESSA